MTKAHLKANAHGDPLDPPMQDPGCVIRAPRIQALKHSGVATCDCHATTGCGATLRRSLMLALYSTYYLGGALSLSASASAWPQVWREGGCGLGISGQRSKRRCQRRWKCWAGCPRVLRDRGRRLYAVWCAKGSDQAWFGLVGFDSGGTPGRVPLGRDPTRSHRIAERFLSSRLFGWLVSKS